MKTIRRDTKQAVRFIDAYWNSQDTLLNDVYERFSFMKQLAYDYCVGLYKAENGERFRIISHNTFQFTCMWQCGSTYRVETANSSYLIL